MLRDSRHAHRKRFGQLRYGGFAGHQVCENGAASGIGKSSKGRCKLVIWHVYLTCWLNTRPHAATPARSYLTYWLNTTRPDFLSIGAGYFSWLPADKIQKERASRSLRTVGPCLFTSHRG